MTRRAMLVLLVIAVCAAVGYWVATRTEWVEMSRAMGLEQMGGAIP